MNHLTTLTATLAIASGASASLHVWDWAAGDPGDYGTNDVAGTWESVHATYNTNTQHLLWEVTFSNQITSGFTLALNDGPNPKGHPGELALIYVDAENPVDVLVTAYGYNGQNLQNSWKDGNGDVGGDQAPDAIHGINDQGWIFGASMADANGKRVFSLDLDLSTINAHAPLYPDAQTPWFGMGFDDMLGLWSHSVTGLDASYNDAGFISKWNYNKEGWFDGQNFETIPTPGAAALAVPALLAGLRRRR